MTTPPESILAAAQNLHMIATGSMDGLSRDELLRLESFLQRRLDSWKPSPRIGALPNIFDDTVKLLVQVALAEFRVSPMHPNWSKAEGM